MHLPHPIVWLRTHPRGADALLAMLIVAAALASHLSGMTSVNDPNQPDTAWWTVLLVLCGTVPVYWRRTHALIVGLAVVSAETAGLFIGLAGSPFLGSVIAVYSIGAHTVGIQRTRVMTAITTIVMALFVAGWIDGLALFDEFISTGVLLITAFVLGDNWRRRRQHVADLAERVERAEREQWLLSEQRVAAERTRIARDLHDVVAHSVSVMVIQAAAARRNLSASPTDTADALEQIESTGRQAMTELRAILGVLRTDASADTSTDTSLHPQPSLANWSALAEMEDLPIEVAVDGDLDLLPDVISVTGYRLVQEALTNVRRHGGPVEVVDVRLCIDGDDLSITVSDDGRGAAARAAPGGFGIIGMSERVAAVGGTLAAGPRPGGGWQVRARLPIVDDTAGRLAPVAP